jgi:hypothetical protein
MIPRRRYELVLAIYPQSRGFAFALFEGWLAPVDWGVQEVRGRDKNTDCLKRVDSVFALHAPDVLVLQDMSEHGTRRARRIKELNQLIAEHAERRAIPVSTYSRAQILERFADHHGMTKQRLAEAIAKYVPALNLYVPLERKPWMSEDARMGIFEAAALAWMYFHEAEGERQAA